MKLVKLSLAAAVAIGSVASTLSADMSGSLRLRYNDKAHSAEENKVNDSDYFFQRIRLDYKMMSDDEMSKAVFQTEVVSKDGESKPTPKLRSAYGQYMLGEMLTLEAGKIPLKVKQFTSYEFGDGVSATYNMGDMLKASVMYVQNQTSGALMGTNGVGVVSANGMVADMLDYTVDYAMGQDIDSQYALFTNASFGPAGVQFGYAGGTAKGAENAQSMMGFGGSFAMPDMMDLSIKGSYSMAGEHGGALTDPWDSNSHIFGHGYADSGLGSLTGSEAKAMFARADMKVSGVGVTGFFTSGTAMMEGEEMKMSSMGGSANFKINGKAKVTVIYAMNKKGETEYNRFRLQLDHKF